MSSLVLRKIQQAREKLDNGDAFGALFLCEAVLQRAPRNPDALWLLGAARILSGQPREAVSPLEHCIAHQPDHGAALEHLGLAYLMLGEDAAAEQALRRALAVPGAPPSVRMRLGIALLNQKRFGEAIAELKTALRMEPGNVLLHLSLGRALGESGDIEAAAQHFETVLHIEPGSADALYNLGVLALTRGELAQAQSWFERALVHAPRHAEAAANLGIALQSQHRLEEAIACFQRALEINPALAPARNNLARTLLLQGQAEKARHEYLRAVADAPGLAEAREGLAGACAALDRHKEAALQWQSLIKQVPGNAGAWTALADALFELGELNDAHDAAARALELDPSLPAPYSLLAQICTVRGDLDRSIEALESGFERTGADWLLGMLSHQRRRTCDWDRWREAWREIRVRLDESAALGSPFWLLHEATTAEQQLSYARRWATARFGKSASPFQAPPPAERARDDRVRVGYLSSDFQEHPAAYLIAGVLEAHDRSRFEIFAYSYGPQQESPMRARLARACEHFIDVAWEPDDAVVRRIRNDALDLLIDLKGYTLGARTSILAQRPCAVQVNWLGYPGSMGAPFIDYLITDSFIVPPGRESAYSERIARLSHCWQCNDRSRPVTEPLARSAYGLREGDFVFCCFSQAVKITPDIFAVWMSLLEAIPQSVLWLAEDNSRAKRNLQAAARAHAVAPERLVFAPRAPFAQYLARYAVADLALDTSPYTSHSTASDALWGGCPLVALCGETFAGRVSGSILAHAGLPELITYSVEDYKTLACKLATDPQALSGVRSRVAAAKASALFDAASFTRDLERIYVDLAGASKGTTAPLDTSLGTTAT